MSVAVPSITPEVIEQHGLTSAEYQTILDQLGREPTIAELGVYSVMWSEHCSYKHSRRHLATLPTSGDRVLHGPGENAGVIDLGNQLACVFKIESHNHPSAVEPHQGAATGVGGILRDIFAMGARPIALLDAIRFGPPDKARNEWIIRGVVNGIADYGNCVGVPTVGGEFCIDDAYSDNCLVNVMCVGVARHDELMTARAEKAGDLLVYYGGSTGRDGVHGATFASMELTDESADNRSSVQVGDPFMEKLILESTLELIEHNLLVALQDMGAAGLTCSSTEMADKAGLGVDLDLDAVPQRARNLSAYELLLSESQERMLAVISPDKLEQVRAVLKKWDLNAHVVGATTNTGRLVVRHHREVEVDVPLDSICSSIPAPAPVASAPPTSHTRHFTSVTIADKEWQAALLDALASPHFASKRWIYEQYDHDVQTNTVVGPGAGVAVLRLRQTPNRFLAVTCDGNGIWVALDPYEGTRALVTEAARNLIAAGAVPLAVTNNLNFGNPRDGEIAWQFAESVRGLADACRALDTPVTGGNVSFYNESPRMAVFPTPVIGMVGVIEDRAHITPASLQHEGDALYLVGPRATHAGASKILRDRVGELVGPAISLDMDAEQASHALVRDVIRAGLIASATDISEGGLLIALAEMSLCSPKNLGIEISLPGDEDTTPSLLSEEPSRFILACPIEHEEALCEHAHRAGVRCVRLGAAERNDFHITGLIDLNLAQLREPWERGQ